MDFAGMLRGLSIAGLLAAAAVCASGQSSAVPADPVEQQPAASAPAAIAPAATAAQANQATPVVAPAVEELLSFKDSDVKFSISELMSILRDRRHEGWVLAAYPDPKTGRPLIGAGVSLDLPEREHVQRDPLNPHPFIEPSSAELWQAAGLDPARLHQILAQYDDNLAAWKKRRYRKKIWSLEPQITDEEATMLMRVAVIQAIDNARAYCRNFDELTASQQMAMSQLVYQMGVNLEEFGQFLKLMNHDDVNRDDASADAGNTKATENLAPADGERWDAVQHSLIQSQWARLYRTRAIAVIAMLDPLYPEDPGVAEQHVAATLRPAVMHRRRGRGMLRTASYTRHTGHASRRRTARLRSKRRA